MYYYNLLFYMYFTAPKFNKYEEVFYYEQFT